MLIGLNLILVIVELFHFIPTSSSAVLQKRMDEFGEHLYEGPYYRTTIQQQNPKEDKEVYISRVAIEHIAARQAYLREEEAEREANRVRIPVKFSQEDRNTSKESK
ncbi:hypothetical protein PGTUg99_007369 [Puccinia graminis f. sp. tritici]|uniref:Uncharacterized protein n=2 Tax=Puccinia graminis f. sp. tritici TaxID=56615 RepID=A0A5B0LH87_PUCGR|nr:hypothetical protein PGTUg99_007369 [Puccinia graminis f. sp. tritici]